MAKLSLRDIYAWIFMPQLCSNFMSNMAFANILEQTNSIFSCLADVTEINFTRIFLNLFLCVKWKKNDNYTCTNIWLLKNIVYIFLDLSPVIFVKYILHLPSGEWEKKHWLLYIEVWIEIEKLNSKDITKSELFLEPYNSL